MARASTRAGSVAAPATASPPSAATPAPATKTQLDRALQSFQILGVIIAAIVGASTVGKAALDLHDSELKDRHEQIADAEQYFLKAADRAAAIRLSNSPASRELLLTSFRELSARAPLAVDPPVFNDVLGFIRKLKFGVTQKLKPSSTQKLRDEAQRRQCLARNFAIAQHRAVALDAVMTAQFTRMLKAAEPWQCDDVLTASADAGAAQQVQVAEAAAERIAAARPQDAEPAPPPPTPRAAPPRAPAPATPELKLHLEVPALAQLYVAPSETTPAEASVPPALGPAEVRFASGVHDLDDKGRATVKAFAERAIQRHAKEIRITSYDTGYNLLARSRHMKIRAEAVEDALRTNNVTVPIETAIKDKIRPDRPDGLKNQRWVEIEALF